MKRILNIVRYIAYIIVLVVDGAITVLSMTSLGHTPMISIFLGIIGGAIVMLMTWMFLTGIRNKGIERVVKLGTWFLAVVLIVSLNWAFTSQNILIQTDASTTQKEDITFQVEFRKTQILSTQDQIEKLIEKESKLNIWQTDERQSINEAIEKARSELTILLDNKIELNEKEIISALNVFDKMAVPLNWAAKDMSDLWWILAFLILQLFAVLTAPKNEDDIEVKKKRKYTRHYTDLELNKAIETWIKINWMGKRTGKDDKILPKDIFFNFMKNRNEVFDGNTYNLIYKTAINNKILDNLTILIEDEEEAIKIIKKNIKINNIVLTK